MKGGFNLSRWALEHIPLTRYLMAVLLIGGMLSYANLGQDEDPPFTFRAMVLQAYWPGATALQMAEQVTDKLEKKLQETPYIDEITSYSKPGETLILLELRESAPPKETAAAWYQVRKKIGDIKGTLPAGVVGPFFNDEFGDTYGSIFALSGDGFTYAEMKDYADKVRQELLAVGQVSKVELFGVQDEKINIIFSHKKFAQLGIPFDAIVQQLSEQNSINATGVLVTPTDNLQVRVTGAMLTVKDLENLELRANGTTFRLGDFATVKREFVDPPKDKMRFNGKEVIGLGVSMEKGGNIIDMGKALQATVTRMKGELPVGIELQRVSNQPEAVSASVGEFVHTLIEAILIVLAVSFVALGLHTKPLRIDVRPGLVVALTIPLVLAVTFLFMRLLDIDLHKISLGALIIALGLLVDDAIIAVEMMVRKMEEGMSRFDAATFAYTSTAMPMLTGTLITVAGFLPIGLAKSAAGEYTFSLFSVNALALIISWVVAVVFTPYIGYILLKVKPHAHNDHELFDTPNFRRFRRAVTWCVEWRKTTIAATLAIFALGIYGFNFIEKQFFPDSSRPELMVELWSPEGTTFAANEKQVKKFEAFVGKLDGVESVTSYVGTGSPRFYLPLDQIFPQTNVSQVVVLPKSLADRERLRQQIVDVFKKDFPEVRGRVKLLPNGPPVPYPVQFRVMGPEVAGVRAIADQVKDIMRANPNTLGVNDNWNESVKVLRLDLDQDKMRALGVTSKTVMQAANTILSGTVIGQFREDNKLIDIQVRQPLAERATISVLNDTNIPTATGKSVPISQLARAHFVWEPGVVWRDKREWAITVQSDVIDGIQGATVSTQLAPQLDALRAKMPAGYRIVVKGVAADSGEAEASISANLPLAIFIIFTLLMLQLHSFSRSLLVFLTGPLGVAGAAFALLALGRPLGFVANLGIIALFGMIIRNSVILVDQIEQDINDGSTPWDAIIDSAVRRCRPIVLTAAAAALAMIPLSRSVFWGPMAVAIMGGLILATALTLLFLPALYAAWFRVKKPEPATAKEG
ncbi:multidrug resistance protein MdtC [Janthinobacterium sp. HH103]|uniref:efflux RND transporter permease subunit n=1 Tax=unclassified Janthinobacterium TaxID=2610881 RepID=UPI000874FE4F|nr:MULTISPECIES: efflux RND transporter permease subunit [unclassified Janthinobacterium]OEZ54127.1 multidrug resistance protein MdtC [Janthinobacterium sp. HH100]OEZ85815.1 multidrug resistance protein MdtC [Janthinobacterium sp. HH103]QOU73562.1 Multidrug resistance protein MdtC [Janthinobacterium sp. HH102]